MKGVALFSKEIRDVRKLAEKIAELTPEKEKLSDEQIDLVKQARDLLMTAANILVHV